MSFYGTFKNYWSRHVELAAVAVAETIYLILQSKKFTKSFMHVNVPAYYSPSSLDLETPTFTFCHEQFLKHVKYEKSTEGQKIFK